MNSSAARPQPATKHTIIVPLGDEPHSKQALPVARAIAAIEGASLHIVHVSNRPESPRDFLMRHGLQKDLANAVVEIRQGEPADTIMRTARERDAAAIVMCTHTGIAQDQGNLGHVASRLFRESACPLVLVKPGVAKADWRLSKALLPHDGAPATAQAIVHARRLVEIASARLTVLHVRDLAAREHAQEGTLRAPQYTDQPQYEWPDWAREFLDRLGKATDYAWLQTNVRLVLGEGRPSSAILGTAKEQHADLIIMAWHGSFAAEHATTFREVIDAAPCPVMILRI